MALPSVPQATGKQSFRIERHIYLCRNTCTSTTSSKPSRSLILPARYLASPIEWSMRRSKPDVPWRNSTSHDLATLTDQSECLNSVTWACYSYWPIRMLEFRHMTWPLLLTNQDAWIQSHDPPSVSTWAIVWRRHSVGHTEYSCPRYHRKHHSLPEHDGGWERLMTVWAWSKFIDAYLHRVYTTLIPYWDYWVLQGNTRFANGLAFL